jgi:hypothetical protein
MVVGVNMSNISTTHNSGKRKKNRTFWGARWKKKQKIIWNCSLLIFTLGSTSW